MNNIRLIVRLVNPSDCVVIRKDCPNSTEKNRIAMGRSLAIKMFEIGVFREISSSKMQAFPPHRIEDILIKLKG